MLIAGIPDNLVAGVLEVTLKEAWWKPQRDSPRPPKPIQSRQAMGRGKQKSIGREPSRVDRQFRTSAAAAFAFALMLFVLLAGPSPAQAAIPFERCEEAGAEEWECATVPVPLDWTGQVPGAIDLEVRRYRPPGTPDPSAKLPFVALAGGPGQSATSVAGLFPRALAPALDEYQLIVYDQRGTGLSGPLFCPDFKEEELETEDGEIDLTEFTRRQIERCAEQLGPKRAFYTTLDSARDINWIRESLDAPRIGIGGISYGTYVSAVYAQQFPNHTDRIILDGVVPPNGGMPAFNLETFTAARQVLRRQCDGGRCSEVTPTPVGDVRRVVGRMSGSKEQSLFHAIESGDLNPALRGGQPAALRAKIKGDGALLRRFLKLAGAGDGDAAKASEASDEDLSQELRQNSQTLQVTTRCTDLVPPWPQSMAPGAERNRLYSNALTAIPNGRYLPFGKPAVQISAAASFCLRWPLTDTGPPPPHPAFPDVPTLIINGTADLRTPADSAIEAARDFAPGAELVLVEGYGHSVLGRAECVESAVASFFADQPVGDPCADADEWARIESLPPRSIRQVKPAAGIGGKRGRTVASVLDTFNDSIWVLNVRLATGLTKASTRGLRGGKFTYASTPKRLSLRFKRLAYVPGVKLNGKLSSTGGEFVGQLRIRGKKAARGKLRFKANGTLFGRLNGKRVRYRPN